MEELWALVKRIPPGRVAAYGALGRALDRPISGYLVGRMMARCPDDVPWWRVVSRDGQMVVHKRDPILAEEQRRKLRAEGVALTPEDTVALPAFIDPDSMADGT